jgi:hypothetical protein
VYRPYKLERLVVADEWMRRRRIVPSVLGLLLGFIAYHFITESRVLAQPPDIGGCPRCGWQPPKTVRTVRVRGIHELASALSRARPSTTVLLSDGTYRLDRMLDINVPDLVLRGASGTRENVQIVGTGPMEKRVGVALSVSAPRVTLADLTVGRVGFHGVQVRGEHAADDLVMHNVRVTDTGQQLLKGSRPQEGRGPDRGLVACCLFDYTEHAPSNYTNGVDVIAGAGWVVHGCVFQQIRGRPEENYSCGPSVLFWGGCRDSVAEGNLFLDCFRGIAFGLTKAAPRRGSVPLRATDHAGGTIRRNVICNRNAWADEAIEVNSSPDTLVEHNTVLVQGAVPWSISVRFATASATVRNNLTSQPLIRRDGGRVLEEAGNIVDARPEWFIDPDRGVLRLAREDLPPVDAAVPTDENRRFAQGRGPDVGAIEYRTTEEVPRPAVETRPEVDGPR